MTSVVGMTSDSDGPAIVFEELFDCIPRQGDLIRMYHNRPSYRVAKVIWNIRYSTINYHTVNLMLEAIEE